MALNRKFSLSVKYCHIVWSDYRRGFGLDIGFIERFNTQLVITFHYIANKLVAHTLVSTVCY
jgi:hypothetical protein